MKNKHVNIEAIPLNEQEKANIPNLRNFSNTSEVIASYALEKIFINCAHIIFLGELYEPIAENCENFLFRIMDNSLKFVNVQRDFDDIDYKQINPFYEYEIDAFGPHNHILYENEIENVNNWDDIEMPVHSNIDREACSTIRLSKYNESRELEYESKRIINKPRVKKPITQNNSGGQDQIIIDKKKKIDGKKYEPFKDKDKLGEEPELIVELRHQVEQKLLKDLEDKKNQEKQVIITINKDKEAEKKQKDLDKKLKTTDAEGKIILIKHIPNEKLGSDFIIPGTQVNFRPASSNEERLTNPFIPKSKLEENANNNVSGSTVTVVKNKDKEKEKEKERDKRNIGLGKKKKEVSLIVNANTNLKNDQQPIIPAGSSFELIVPMEGVTIIEGKRKKGGSNNFLKAFNKYSDYDYKSMLKEICGNNTLKDTMEQLMGTSREEDKINNLTLPPILSNNNKNIINSPSLKTKKKEEKNAIIINRAQALTMKQALDSLNMPEDKYEHISQLDKNEKMKNSNVFKEKSKDKFRDTISLFNATNTLIGGENQTNTFNQSIINNSLWGTSGPSKKFNMTSEIKKIKKPDVTELEIELGKNVLHSKLPRARMRSDIKSPESFVGVKKNSSIKKLLVKK